MELCCRRRQDFIFIQDPRTEWERQRRRVESFNIDWRGIPGGCLVLLTISEEWRVIRKILDQKAQEEQQQQDEMEMKKKKKNKSMKCGHKDVVYVERTRIGEWWAGLSDWLYEREGGCCGRLGGWMDEWMADDSAANLKFLFVKKF